MKKNPIEDTAEVHVMQLPVVVVFVTFIVLAMVGALVWRAGRYGMFFHQRAEHCSDDNPKDVECALDVVRENDARPCQLERGDCISCVAPTSRSPQYVDISHRATALYEIHGNQTIHYGDVHNKNAFNGTNITTSNSFNDSSHNSYAAPPPPDAAITISAAPSPILASPNAHQQRGPSPTINPTSQPLSQIRSRKTTLGPGRTTQRPRYPEFLASRWVALLLCLCSLSSRNTKTHRSRSLCLRKFTLSNSDANTCYLILLSAFSFVNPSTFLGMVSCFLTATIICVIHPWLGPNLPIISALTWCLFGNLREMFAPVTPQTTCAVWGLSVWVCTGTHIRDLRDLKADEGIGRKISVVALRERTSRIFVTFVLLLVEIVISWMVMKPPYLLIVIFIHGHVAWRLMQVGKGLRYHHTTYMIFVWLSGPLFLSMTILAW